MVYYTGIVEGIQVSGALKSLVGESETETKLRIGETVNDITNVTLTGELIYFDDHMPKLVNDERDRRIVSGFSFAGTVFDFDMRSKTNISGAATMALMAKVGGAQAGDLRWNGGTTDFTWISQDNTAVPMDVDAVIAFGRTAAAHEQAHVFAARALKDQSPIPDDFADDKYWPNIVA